MRSQHALCPSIWSLGIPLPPHLCNPCEACKPCEAVYVFPERLCVDLLLYRHGAEKLAGLTLVWVSQSGERRDVGRQRERRLIPEIIQGIVPSRLIDGGAPHVGQRVQRPDSEVPQEPLSRGGGVIAVGSEYGGGFKPLKPATDTHPNYSPGPRRPPRVELRQPLE